ncbi:TPA: hypothetical protein DEP21_04545 [Patescibacteria group bacterium]|nr:hypothetical protein [Candidatus Gracilibacteria bacterium]
MVKVFDLFLFGMEEGKSILVDGFPRQIAQMHGFVERMNEYKRDFVVIVLDINKEEAVKRLTSRRMCKSCGAILNIHLHACDSCTECGSSDLYQRVDDQDLDAINTRIGLFEKETLPVIQHLE